MHKDRTAGIYDEEIFYDLKAKDVRKWYVDHYSEEELAGVYELTYRLWKYYKDCISDHEKETPEYSDALRVFQEWDTLKTELENDIKNIMNSLNMDVTEPDKGILDLFMVFNGYENSGDGWTRRE